MATGGLHRWSPADRVAPGLAPGLHLDLVTAAIVVEGDAQRRLLEGDADGARPLFRAAAAAWRASWEHAGPESVGRILGMLKAAIIAGGGADEAAYARAEIVQGPASPPAAYALALCAAVEGDDATLAACTAAMRPGGPPFARVADALDALAAGDRADYAAAVGAVVSDFEDRDEHLTGVAIADTAVMLEELAARRGMAWAERSRVLPPRP